MPPETEFQRPLVLATLPPGGRTLTLEASPDECAALARRFGILGLDSVTATLRVLPEPGGTVLVEGRMAAKLTQACVVTLDPVAQEVDEPVAFRLLPPGQEPQDGPDDPDEIEAPEGTADLGEVLAEQLALALDPYPRAPGAELPPEAGGAVTGGFAALAALRRKN
ncbi:DUF177 domain-containing protein [Belnapia sp. T6]|uniref:DUF177 domain-containing protein n=1 Tax=Belnapia mucosa TaxID=2804532 RepID=A0ABS1UYD6_9PROT|nr:DUF177 domain-containing protein [Belnapia mucosa]MBL6454484.1 DUF177 domain-containing protein [Belnapia mucosa]